MRLITRAASKRVEFGCYLFAASLALLSNALAQTGTSYQERLAVFALQLESAKNSQAEFGRIAGCLQRHESALEQQSKDLQLRLGPLIAQDDDLEAQVKSLVVASDEYGRILADSVNSVAELEKKIEKHPNRKMYEAYERLCNIRRINPWDLRWCGRRMRSSTFETAKADLDAARKRRDIALGTVNNAKEDRDKAESSLAQTRTQMASTRSTIDETTKRIVSTKKSILEVTFLDQPLLISIDEFGRELRSATQVDVTDERPRTIRKLDDISQALDKTMGSGRAATLRVDEALGAGWVKTCLAN